MERAARSNSWKRQPFGEGVPIDYRTTLNSKQFEYVRLGIIPQQMEDKWFVYYQEPYLYFHRSWTGSPIYRLRFEGRDGLFEVAEALLDTEWAKQPGIDIAYETQLLDFLLYSLVLREPKEFPMPDARSTQPKGLYQHIISGTGFPESIPKPDEEETGE